MKDSTNRTLANLANTITEYYSVGGRNIPMTAAAMNQLADGERVIGKQLSIDMLMRYAKDNTPNDVFVKVGRANGIVFEPKGKQWVAYVTQMVYLWKKGSLRAEIRHDRFDAVGSDQKQAFIRLVLKDRVKLMDFLVNPRRSERE